MPRHTTDDGCRLAYSVAGRAGAPVLVLSHSLGSDAGLWDRQASALEEHYRVVRYDTRGHGASDAPVGDYTIERLAKDVLSLMDVIGADRADVCGISLGGMTALWLGAHAAARVRRLVLANTAARIGSTELWNERIRVATTQGLEALADAALARWFTAPFRDAEPETMARFRETMTRTPVAGYAGCSAALRDADLSGVAPSVRAPCLVVTGAHDVSTPPEAGRSLVDAIPGARLCELDAAHLTNVERAAEFTSAVERFLSE